MALLIQDNCCLLLFEGRKDRKHWRSVNYLDLYTVCFWVTDSYAFVRLMEPSLPKWWHSIITRRRVSLRARVGVFEWSCAELWWLTVYLWNWRSLRSPFTDDHERQKTAPWNTSTYLRGALWAMCTVKIRSNTSGSHSAEAVCLEHDVLPN